MNTLNDNHDLVTQNIYVLTTYARLVIMPGGVLFSPAITTEGVEVNAMFQSNDARMECLESQQTNHMMACLNCRVGDFYDDFDLLVRGDFNRYFHYNHPEALQDNVQHLDYVVDSFYELILIYERNIMVELWRNLRLQWSVIELSKVFDGHVVEKIVYWATVNDSMSCPIWDHMNKLIPSQRWPYREG